MMGERRLAPVARDRARLREVKFSFACQKRTRKAPAARAGGAGQSAFSLRLIVLF